MKKENLNDAMNFLDPSLIEEAAPGATVLQGLAVVGSTAQNDPETTSASVSAWLADLGLGE